MPSLAPPEQQDGGTRRLPVLIIPGFMSSGLEVRNSGVSESWIGKRVWLNLSELGFGSIYRGGALQKNETMRDVGDRSYSPAMNEEYRQQIECKSAWLQHMSLSNDMIAERPNMEVRPIPGLAGVDYLAPGALTAHLSYVFGPVIEALKKAGYAEGHNLDAVPYDWRLPPSALEERDEYFTRTMQRVEEMFLRNRGTPVVLLCHSLGCKMGHYFLNFVKSLPGGDEWLNLHIHTYMPVGAPHLGAPKALRGVIDGDKMGLEAFLSDEEGLLMGRSLGSAPWMFPEMLPATGDAMPNAFVRREGALEVTVPPIDCSTLILSRKGQKTKLRLAVAFGGEVLTTDFHTLGGENGATLIIPETFVFSTPPDLYALKERHSSDTFQVLLQEKGFRQAKNETIEKTDTRRGFDCIICLVCCPIKYFLCLPCTIAGCIVWKTLCVTKDIALAGVNMTAIALNAGTTLALSEPCSIRHQFHQLHGKSKVNLLSSMVHIGDKGRLFDWFRKSRKTTATIELKWTPPIQKKQSPSNIAETSDRSPKSYGLNLVHNNKDQVEYEACDSTELLQNEKLDLTLSLVRERYNGDPMGPCTLSADRPPPVRRVKAVYGINLPTEVGAVYRRQKACVLGPGAVQKLQMLDTKVRNSKLYNGNRAYKIQDGRIMETSKSPQIVEGKIVHRCGDGTVPYWSLQHCRTWKGACDVSIEEIEGADHRDILADPRFHTILIDYVTGNSL